MVNNNPDIVTPALPGATATFYSAQGNYICVYDAGTSIPWIVSSLDQVLNGISVPVRAEAVTLMAKLEARRIRPTHFAISFTQGKGVQQMPNKAHAVAVDFQLADNGSANATLSLVDAAGLPAVLPAGSTITVPTWTPSNPAITVTPAADGMSAVVTPSSPPVAITDVTITISAATVTNSDASTETIAGVVSQGIDVVGGGPAGFAISI